MLHSSSEQHRESPGDETPYKKYGRHIITPPDVYTRTCVLASPVAGPAAAAAAAAAAAVPPPSLLLLLLLLQLLLCRCSLLRAFKKTKNEKQSVVTGCAPRCIADREAAAAQQQQQHSSSSSSSGGGGGGAAAAAASSPSEPRAGCCVVSPLPSVCVLFLCVCTSGCPSLPWNLTPPPANLALIPQHVIHQASK